MIHPAPESVNLYMHILLFEVKSTKRLQMNVRQNDSSWDWIKRRGDKSYGSGFEEHSLKGQISTILSTVTSQ